MSEGDSEGCSWLFWTRPLVVHDRRVGHLQSKFAIWKGEWLEALEWTTVLFDAEYGWLLLDSLDQASILPQNLCGSMSAYVCACWDEFAPW